MKRGYVKLWRKTSDTGLSCLLMGLWMHCLIEAANVQHSIYINGQEVVLEPGQFIFGRNSWGKRLGVTEKCLRIAMGNLQKRAMIRASKRANTFTVYEVANWGTYQQTEKDKGQQKGQQKGQLEGQQRASKGPHLKNEEHVSMEDSKSFCADPSEAEGHAPQVIDPVAFELPLNVAGEVYPITEGMIAKLVPLYPAVNVRECIGTALGWLIGNPENRKTKAGVMRFVTSWLAKEQNRGGAHGAQTQPRATTVHQQKQVEGGQKARLLLEMRKAEDGQGNDAEVANACRPALPAGPGGSGVGGNGLPVAGGAANARPY